MLRRLFSSIIGEGEQKLFVRLTSQTFILRLVGMMLLYGNQVLMARLMGAGPYGDYTVILTWINFMVAFSIFGFDHGAQRFFSQLYSNQDWARLRGFVRFSFRIILAVSVCGMVGWFLYLWNTQSSRMPYPRTYSEAFLWAMFIIFPLAFIYQSSSVFRAFHKIRISISSIYLLLPLGISLASILYYSSNGKLRADAAILINLLCTALVAWYMFRRIRKTLRPKYENAEPVYEKKLWLTAAFTYLCMNLLTLLIKQADILFVSHYFGHTEAGIYSAAAKISALVPFGLTIVEFVYTPRISTLYAENDTARLQHYISHAAKLILLITVPLSLVLIASGKYLLLLFGEEFQASYLPLIILVAGQLINAFTGMVGSLMTMTGKQNIFLLVYFVSSILNLLLNYLLVPAYGATGAAVASAVSVASLNIIMYFVVKKRLQINASIFYRPEKRS